MYAVLETLPLFADVATPGLLGSTLYDTFPLLSDASGTTRVNASQFLVSCSALNNASVGGFQALSDGVAFPDTFHVNVGTDAVVTVDIPVGA